MMNCPNCGIELTTQTTFCPNCGTKLNPAADQAPVQPAAPVQAPGYPPVQAGPYNPVPNTVPVTYAPQQPVSRPAQPLVGMICGIVSAILAFITYFVVIGSAAFDGSVSAVGIILALIGVGLAIFSLIFSIIGLRRSIHTGGRKYVAGIVFSAVGIASSAFALLFLVLAVVFGVLIDGVKSYSYRRYY